MGNNICRNLPNHLKQPYMGASCQVDEEEDSGNNLLDQPNEEVACGVKLNSHRSPLSSGFVGRKRVKFYGIQVALVSSLGLHL